MDRLTPSNALAALRQQPRPFIELFQHGSLAIEYYRPVGRDRQAPHSRDEVYVVIAGHGTVLAGDTERPFEAGEVLFAPAGLEHRFTSFSEDFATWVIFYGPEGGEAEEAAP